MNFKQTTVFIIFILAFVLLLSFAFLFASEGFYALSPKGFKPETLSSLPDWLAAFYQGNPSLMALLTYVLFTLSAFLFLREKKRIFKIISALSFVFLLCIFLFLM